MSFQYKSKMCSESVLLKYSLKYQLFLQKLHLISQTVIPDDKTGLGKHQTRVKQ